MTPLPASTSVTTSPVAPQGARRSGFALPLTLLVIVFLTVSLAAAFGSASSEILTTAAQRGEARAFMLAQAGLESFMARRNEVGFCALCGAPPTTTYESTTVRLPGGYVEVVAQQVRVATRTRPAIYLLRSRGVDTSSALTGASRARYGERAVAQLVYWNVNQVNVLSGWTATSGLDKNGSAGTISGVDGCAAGSGGGLPTVAGIAVPDGGFTGNGHFTPDGNPPVRYLGNQAATNAATRIDWNGIVNGSRIQPDYTFASGTAALAGWPAANPNAYPVIRVNGDFTLPLVGGQGTLIVLGNFTISGNNLWHGILLVGGTMTSNGNGAVNGATMSGLNTLLTAAQLDTAQRKSSSPLSATPAAATANGTKTFQYNSCDVANAAGGLASYSVYPNAWMDNLVTY